MLGAAESRPSHPQSHSLSQQCPVSAIAEGDCEIPLDLQSHQAQLSPQKEYFHRSSCSLRFSFLLLAYLIEVSPPYPEADLWGREGCRVLEGKPVCKVTRAIF